MALVEKAKNVYVIEDDKIVVEIATAIGPPGVGVPQGGSVGQVLSKTTSDDYDTQWIDLPGPQIYTLRTVAEENVPIFSLTPSSNTHYFIKAKIDGINVDGNAGDGFFRIIEGMVWNRDAGGPDVRLVFDQEHTFGNYGPMDYPFVSATMSVGSFVITVGAGNRTMDWTAIITVEQC